MLESEQPSAPVEKIESPEAIYPQTAEQAFADRLELSTERLSTFYDQAVAEDKNPRQLFTKQTQRHKLSYVHGEDEAKKYFAALEELPDNLPKEEFIDRIREIVSPFLWRELVDPVVAARQAEFKPAKRNHFESLKSGLSIDGVERTMEQELRFSKRDEEDEEIVLPVGTQVMEVAWPKKTTPQGLHGMKDVFRVMASYLQEHPEFKAVTGVSWMMAYPISRHLGFTVMPDMKVPGHQVVGSARMGNEARVAKGLEPDIAPEDVLFGAMTREEFLRRFGE